MDRKAEFYKQGNFICYEDPIKGVESKMTEFNREFDRIRSSLKILKNRILLKSNDGIMSKLAASKKRNEESKLIERTHFLQILFPPNGTS